MPLRAVVIGCGWIGSEVADDPLADGVQSHAGAYVACDETQLVGVCDYDVERAERAARRWNLPKADRTVAALLQNTQPEIVSVCTSDESHASVLNEVLQYPGVRAIVAEKPLSKNADEALAIVKLAKEKGVVLAVNYSRRFAQSHREVRRRIVAGDLGSIRSVHGFYCKGIAHNGTHWFDLARWLVGEIVAVQAWPNSQADVGEDPTCDVRVEFEGGASGLLKGVDEAHFTLFEMDIVGTAGRVRLSDSGLTVEWSLVGPSSRYSGYRVLKALGESPAGFRDVALDMVKDVVAATIGGRIPACNGADGVAALAIADAARKSLTTANLCKVMRIQ